MTGMVQTFTAANFAASPAPLYVKRNNGFPVPNLTGLWLLQDGSVGSAMPSSLANAVSGGPAATKITTTATITRRAYGMEINPGTAIAMYDTGVSVTPSFSAVIAARLTNAATVSIGFPTLFRRIAANDGAMNIQTTTSGATDGLWGGLVGANVDRIAGSKAHEVGVLAMRFDGATGTISVRDHAGRVGGAVHAGLIDHFAAVTDRWKFGLQSTTADLLTCEFYCAATYGVALSDGLFLDAVNAAAAVCVGRGLTLST